MTTRLKIRAVEHSDGASIAKLLAKTPMPGPVGISPSYGIPFWDSFEVEGRSPKGVVALTGDCLVGVGLITRRKVWLNGEVTEVGYLNSLRVAPEFRSGFAVAKGFDLLREIHHRELRLPVYLTSIMRGNDLAARTLMGKRAGLPEYRLLSSYKTFALPTWQWRPSTGRLTILSGAEAGLDAVLHCLATFGRNKDLFPVIEAEDILGEQNGLRGLDLDSFHVAYRSGEPVGTAAVWDQSSFKKYCITGYKGMLKPVETLSKLLTKACGRGIIPHAGTALGPVYLACPAIKDNDPLVFRALLNASLARAKVLKKNWLLAGLFADDTLVQAFHHKLKLTFDSDIYRVVWDDGEGAGNDLGSELYLEVGSL